MMKKLVALVLSLIIIASLSIPVYADLGQAEFENWFIVCGMDGFDFQDRIYGQEPFESHIEPGTRLRVHEFNEINQTYLLVISDDNYNTGGIGFVYVTEDQLDKYFLEDNKTVDKTIGSKKPKEIECTVTSNTGIVLRQGPATTFKAYTTIPHNAKISYQYAYKYGGYNWGYVTYKGTSGWACIDFAKATSVTTVNPTKSSNSTTAATSPTATVSSADVIGTTADNGISVISPNSDYSFTESVTGQENNPDNSTSKNEFFSNTKNVIIVCCVGALIVAMSAVIILLLIQRKRGK